MTVFHRIETLRKEAGISQGKLEKELGFSNGSISKWKNSTPNPERLKKLADYFDVSVEYLMTGEETRFTVEQAKLDVQLAKQQKRIKEYMLKFANLSEEKRNQIMSLIDMLEDK